MSSFTATPTDLHHVRTRPVPAPLGLVARLTALEAMLKGILERWSAPALRVALGLVFVVFGVLKFFPGVSPVEPLVEATWGVLTLGIVGGHLALVLTAIIETLAGLAIISGVFARFGLVMLAIAFVGILSPLVFFPGELFSAAGPTLLGQYVLKNVVLIAAALVVASKALRGPVRSAR
ncbi:MAG: DoxX family rane protein [Agromyces sp.]|jgi:uncharacterized membrane protein YphA (DoxX/SURF4 family)|nr:DoxX family rane protein [Agromyces sp.]